MPKSRQNKDRKEKLNKFKTKQKNKFIMEKNIQAPQPRDIRQVPFWDPTASLQITGSEFEALQNFFNVYAQPIAVMQSIFARGMDAGTIQSRFQDSNGKEIPKEEVDAYLKEIQEYRNAIMAEQNSADAPTDANPVSQSTEKSKKSKTPETEVTS